MEEEERHTYFVYNSYTFQNICSNVNTITYLAMLVNIIITYAVKFYTSTELRGVLLEEQ